MSAPCGAHHGHNVSGVNGGVARNAPVRSARPPMRVFTLGRGLVLASLVAVGDSLAARNVVRSSTRVPTPAVRMVELTQTRTLAEWLDELKSPALARTLSAIFTAASQVASKVRTSSCDSIEGCFNTLSALDEEQYAIDLLANTVMYERLQEAGTVSTVSSTEEPYEIPMGGSGFSVAFDPLDSAASVDVNFAVGSSWGVWSGSRLTGVKGRDAAAAGLAMYGPRTAMLVATADADGVVEFVLSDALNGKWEWLLSNRFEVLQEDQPFRRAIFAPGNLRATADNLGYRKLIDHYINERYHLRYSGGMVPDVLQLVVKGRGIFLNPDGGAAAPARIRLLYEAAPAAFIVEKAGGASSDGERSLLDIVIEDTDQRTQVAVGSKLEVARFDSTVGPVKRSAE